MVRKIILIVIDCLRADHVSAYGYGRPTTPTIDSLAERGLLWEHAHSASSWTKPSVTSLLTGLYPGQHGVFRGIKRSRDRLDNRTDALSPECPTVAERLSASGWACGAFINNAQLDTHTNLNRGFATYEPHAGKADPLLERFEAWWLETRDQPAFAYLHFLEAHWPYKPRRRHVTMFGGDRDTNCFRGFSAKDFGKMRRDISRGERTLSDDELVQLTQLYDGSIRRLDGKVKRLLGMLDGWGARHETAVLVTADHGDELMDHHSIGHGHTLYDELTHVPLIAQIPGRSTGVRHTAPVSHVDLADTITDIAGIASDGGSRSLLNEYRTVDDVGAELCIRNRYTQTVRHGRWKLYRRFKFHPPEGLVTDSTHSPRAWLDEFPHDVTCELYDTESDPSESNDLAAADSNGRFVNDLNAMILRADRWWDETTANAPTSEAMDIAVDERTVQRLRDLGYID